MIDIDIDLAIEEFIKYTNNFDLNCKHILLKQKHSLRVMKLSKEIAESLNLNEEQIKLATLIGLLHDIARFEQYTQYKTFYDALSFDHGDYGEKILKQDIRRYIKTNKYDDIIINAVKNHNKFSIDSNLNDEEKFYTKIVRDADKIDILYEDINMFWIESKDNIENSIITDSVYEQFKNKVLIKRKKENQFSEIDTVIADIALIFDLNFKESFKIIKKDDYINKIIDEFNFTNEDTKEKMKEIKKIMNTYIEKTF